jgi:hypothetical protein
VRVVGLGQPGQRQGAGPVGWMAGAASNSARAAKDIRSGASRCRGIVQHARPECWPRGGCRRQRAFRLWLGAIYWPPTRVASDQLKSVGRGLRPLIRNPACTGGR